MPGSAGSPGSPGNAAPAGGASPSERLADLGLALPPVAAPAGAYVPAIRDGDRVWTAGQLPIAGGKLAATGRLGEDVDVAEGARLARLCALNALAAAASVSGGLDNIDGIVKVVGFVASTPTFTAQPAVLNGASELLGAVFGAAGVHVRSAVGVAVLPLGAPVEVELIARVAT